MSASLVTDASDVIRDSVRDWNQYGALLAYGVKIALYWKQIRLRVSSTIFVLCLLHKVYED